MLMTLAVYEYLRMAFLALMVPRSPCWHRLVRSTGDIAVI
jgi:hypothetical protein